MSTHSRTHARDDFAPVDSSTALTGRRTAATAVAYLAPPAMAAVLAYFVVRSGVGQSVDTLTRLALAGGALLVGLVAGVLAGRAASAAERRALARGYEQRLDDLDHDLRAPMTIIRGEVELVLSQESASTTERATSSAAIIEQLERLELLLRRRYRP